jgi:hypothetical protein
MRVANDQFGLSLCSPVHDIPHPETIRGDELPDFPETIRIYIYAQLTTLIQIVVPDIGVMTFFPTGLSQYDSFLRGMQQALKGTMVIVQVRQNIDADDVIRFAVHILDPDGL